MKRIVLTTTAIAALFGGVCTASAQSSKEQTGIARDLSAQDELYYSEPGPAYSGYYYYRGPRANSVLPGTRAYGPCGLPDHGAPNSALNLNNRCDNEEFVRRNQGGSPQN